MFSTLQRQIFAAAPRATLRFQSTAPSATSAIASLRATIKPTNSTVADLNLNTSTSASELIRQSLNKTQLTREDPKQTAMSMSLTGPKAGRQVNVINRDLNTAFKRLRGVISANNIKGEKMAQRFYKKPGKVAEEKRIRRKKRIFDEGVRRLMNVVVEAKRRGY